ncbi:MAG: hypothetical protein DRQ55_07870 [Planctomycetota bacterium]|nr:MAG: hypothetical protein DRQ55_07870 [Planctomycetota bacterium]
MGSLLAILALALGLRVVAWQRAAMMFNDGPNFLWQAERLAQGDWIAALSHPYHPLYGALTALVRPLFGSVESAALAVSIASGLLLCVAAWGVARALLPGERAAGPAAALVAAVATRSLDVTADIQADGLFAALALCAVWATLSAANRSGGVPAPAGSAHERPDPARATLALLATAGVATGLAYLTRAEGLFVALAPGLWLLAGGPAPALRARLKGVAMFALALLLTLSPYAVALHEITGQWCLSLKPSMSNVGLGLSGPMWQAPADSPLGWPLVPSEEDPLERPGHAAPAIPPRQGAMGPTLNLPLWMGLVATASAAPAALPSAPAPSAALAPNARGLKPQAPPEQPPPALRRMSVMAALNGAARRLVVALRGETIVLLLPGLALLLRERRRATMAGLLMLALWVLVCAVQLQRSHFLTNRHMLLALALVLPAAGIGLLRMWRGKLPLRLLALLALIVAAGAGTRAQRTHHLPRIEALRWVTEHTSPEQYVVSHRQRDGWYAQRPAITAQLPVYDQILRSRLQEFDTPYLVLSVARLSATEPHWLSERLVHEVIRFGAGDETVAVYEPRFGPR